MGDPYLLDTYMQIFMTALTVLAILLALFCWYLYLNRKNMALKEEQAENQQKLREEILDSVDELVIVIDPEEMRVYWANEACKDFLMMPRDKILGMEISRISMLEQNPKVREAIRTCSGKDEEFDGIIELERGKSRIAHNVRIFSCSMEGVNLIVFTAKNIADRVREIESMRDSGEKIREIEKLGKLGYWEMMNESRKLTWSRGLYEILGYDVNEIRPNLDFLYQMILPEEQTTINRAFVSAFQNQQAVDQILKIKNHKGEMMTVMLRVRHSFDRKNNLVSTLGYMQDISELSRLESDLDYQTQLSMSILDHADILLFAVDEDNNVILVNSFLQKLIGKNEEEIVGQPADDFLLRIIEGNQNRFSKTHYFEGVIEMSDTAYGNRFIRWSLSRFTTLEGKELTICLGIDMTQSELTRKRLSFKAEHEEITGFYNRQTFNLELTKFMLKSRHRSERKVGLIEIIMGGEGIADHAITHDARTAALQAQAARIRDITQGRFLVDFSGTDTFRILVPNRDSEELQALVEELVGALSRPIELEDRSLIPSPHAGCVYLTGKLHKITTFTDMAEETAMQAFREDRPIVFIESEGDLPFGVPAEPEREAETVSSNEDEDQDVQEVKKQKEKA